MLRLRNLLLEEAASITGSEVHQNPAPDTAQSAYGIIQPIDTLAHLACCQPIDVMDAEGPGRC
jgi:hypothetical protein